MVWYFKENLEPIGTSEPYYDLFDGGYIKPSEILEDKNQIQRIEDAIVLIDSFLNTLEEEGLLEFV